jgi:hypothetical protein
MSNSILLNPKHWHDRAEKTRAKADVILRDEPANAALGHQHWLDAVCCPLMLPIHEGEPLAEVGPPLVLVASL